MRARWLPPTCLVAAILTGCGGGSDSGTAAPTPSVAVVTPSQSACPGAAAAPKVSWPTTFPADLPRPPSSSTAVPVSAQSVPGLSIVRFSTNSSIREGILFAVDRVPKAGFTLGRGDAEAFEADVPFSRGGIRGLYRMAYGGPCTTQWLVAVAKVGGTSPLLPTPSASPSPLPFGP